MVLPIPASLAAQRDVLFSEFGGAVSLVHCLRTAVVTGQGPAEAVVAVAAELSADVEESLGARGVSARVVAVAGPGSRQQCLAAGLAELSRSTRYVLVHDIHRALASTDLADRILDELRRGADVVVPALAMVDSVKTVNSAGSVTETVDRTLLRAAQFPRGFARRRLTEILANLGTGDFDDAVLAPRAGVDPTVIDGDPDAFALDLPRDVGLADAIYHCRLARQR